MAGNQNGRRRPVPSAPSLGGQGMADNQNVLRDGEEVAIV